MTRTLAALLLAFGVVLGLVGLSFRASAPAPAELRFVNGTEPRSLDPGVITGAPEGRIADALFEGLLVRDPKTLRPVPGVAASYTVSPDGQVYTFRLRREARWSDGRPVTAHDFSYAWRRLQDPARGAEYAYILHPVRFAEAFNTYGAQADALAGPVAEAIAALRSASPEGVPLARWRRFVAEHHLNDRLRGTTEVLLQAALDFPAEHLGAEELAAIASALATESQRRRALFEEAERRFGVDGGVYAADDHTLVVELVAPTPYLLELVAFYPAYPVPRWVVEREGDDWFLPATLVSNGPFELAEWRVNDRIRLERSEHYWNAQAIRLRSIDALPIENATTSLNLYLTGEVDWLPGLYPNDLVDVLRERDDFYSGPGMVVYYYRFNCRRPPFDDPRVRQALSLAIERRSITDNVLRLGQLPAHHIVPPGMPDYTPPPSALGFDVEKARSLLAEAGYPDGVGFPAVGILYNTQEAHKQVAEVIADQLRRNLGIEVRAYNQEWQAYQASTQAGDYDMARAGWIGDYLDANTFLDLWVTGGGNNQTGWGDPRYDRLLLAARDPAGFAAAPEGLLARLREPDRMRALLAAAGSGDIADRRASLARLRAALLAEAEAILLQEAFPVMPIYFYVVSGLVAPHVGGFYAELVDADGSRRPNLQDLHPLRGMWVD